LPHAPQLALSVASVTQLEPHTLWLAGQATTQAPLTQACPLAQPLPHAPQFS
jgi:hypothetical protein